MPLWKQLFCYLYIDFMTDFQTLKWQTTMITLYIHRQTCQPKILVTGPDKTTTILRENAPTWTCCPVTALGTDPSTMTWSWACSAHAAHQGEPEVVDFQNAVVMLKIEMWNKYKLRYNLFCNGRGWAVGMGFSLGNL